jgi:hypothetical protein
MGVVEQQAKLWNVRVLAGVGVAGGLAAKAQLASDFVTLVQAVRSFVAYVGAA